MPKEARIIPDPKDRHAKGSVQSVEEAWQRVAPGHPNSGSVHKIIVHEEGAAHFAPDGFAFPYIETDSGEGSLKVYTGNIRNRAGQMGVDPQEALDDMLRQGLTDIKPLLG